MGGYSTIDCRLSDHLKIEYNVYVLTLHKGMLTKGWRIFFQSIIRHQYSLDVLRFLAPLVILLTVAAPSWVSEAGNPSSLSSVVGNQHSTV